VGSEERAEAKAVAVGLALVRAGGKAEKAYTAILAKPRSVRRGFYVGEVSVTSGRT
jgi:hypothetical protein